MRKRTSSSQSFTTKAPRDCRGAFLFSTWVATRCWRDLSVELLPPETPNAAAVKALLDKYVMITVVHAQLDKTTAKLSFEDVNTVQAEDQSGKPLPSISGNELPPAARGAVALLEAMFRQSAGAFGQAMKIFVFDAEGVTSCKPGGLMVPFAGETYTWQTPIPGCAGQ